MCTEARGPDQRSLGRDARESLHYPCVFTMLLRGLARASRAGASRTPGRELCFLAQQVSPRELSVGRPYTAPDSGDATRAALFAPSLFRSAPRRNSGMQHNDFRAGQRIQKTSDFLASRVWLRLHFPVAARSRLCFPEAHGPYRNRPRTPFPRVPRASPASPPGQRWARSISAPEAALLAGGADSGETARHCQGNLGTWRRDKNPRAAGVGAVGGHLGLGSPWLLVSPGGRGRGMWGETPVGLTVGALQMEQCRFPGCVLEGGSTQGRPASQTTCLGRIRMASALGHQSGRV